ncbi:MAG: glycosyltransferase family 39 protein [Calditrichaceae bacterium]
MKIPFVDLSKRIPISDKTLIVLIGITALFTRFYHIGKDSLWLDEAAIMAFATEPFWEMLSSAFSDPALPLFPFTLFFWLKIFGTGIVAARSISVLFSLLSVFLVFQIISSLFDKNTAIITVILFVLSPFQVYYAQELRVYSMLQFLGLVSVYSFINLLDEVKPSRVFIYILTIALILYAHVYGWFLLLFQWFWAYYVWRNGRLSLKRLLHVLYSGSAAIFLFMPYFFYYFRMILSVRNEFWIKSPNLIHLAGIFEQYAGYLPLFIFLFPFAFLTSFLFIRNKVKEGEQHRILFLLCWAAFPIIIPFIISHVISPMFQVRYTIFAAVPFYALTAFGINKISNRPLFRLSLLLLIIIAVIGLHKHNSSITREPWDQVVMDLKLKTAPNEPILVGADFCYNYLFLYYGKDLAEQSTGLSETDVKSGEKLEKMISEIRDDSKSVWFVSSHFDPFEETVLNHLRPFYKQHEKFTYYYRDLYDRDIPGIVVYHLTSTSEK